VVVRAAVVGGVGIILILLGIGAGFYQSTTSESHLFGLFSTSSTSTRYRAFMVPLIVVGAVFAVAGVVIGLQKRKRPG